MMAGAATSQRTAAVPAKAPRLSPGGRVGRDKHVRHAYQNHNSIHIGHVQYKLWDTPVLIKLHQSIDPTFCWQTMLGSRCRSSEYGTYQIANTEFWPRLSRESRETLQVGFSWLRRGSRSLYRCAGEKPTSLFSHGGVRPFHGKSTCPT